MYEEDDESYGYVEEQDWTTDYLSLKFYYEEQRWLDLEHNLLDQECYWLDQEDYWLDQIRKGSSRQSKRAFCQTRTIYPTGKKSPANSTPLKCIAN